jgi:hypothetical protein
MADPGNCLEKIKTHKDEGITQTVGIVPYFTRLTSKPFDVYTCSKEYTRLLTYTSFFGYKSVRTEAIINEAITAEQCIELVNEIKQGSGHYKHISPTVWERSNDTHVSYSYCCREIRSITTRYIIMQGSSTIQYKTNTLISSLFGNTDCTASSNNCTLHDSVAIWELSSDNTCHLLRGRIGLGQRQRLFIYSQEMTLAVQLSDTKEHTLCNGVIKAFPTFEGLYVALTNMNHDTFDRTFVLPDGRRTNRNAEVDDALSKLGLGASQLRNFLPTHTNPEHYYKWQRIMHTQIGEHQLRGLHNNSLTTDILGLISFVFMSAQLTSQQLFLHNWFEICQIQVTRYHLYLNLQHVNPTAIARSIIQNQNVVARSAGPDGLLQIFACKEVDQYRFRPITNRTLVTKPFL